MGCSWDTILSQNNSILVGSLLAARPIPCDDIAPTVASAMAKVWLPWYNCNDYSGLCVMIIIIHVNYLTEIIIYTHKTCLVQTICFIFNQWQWFPWLSLSQWRHPTDNVCIYISYFTMFSLPVAGLRWSECAICHRQPITGVPLIMWLWYLTTLLLLFI